MMSKIVECKDLGIRNRARFYDITVMINEIQCTYRIGVSAHGQALKQENSDIPRQIWIDIREYVRNHTDLWYRD